VCYGYINDRKYRTSITQLGKLMSVGPGRPTSISTPEMQEVFIGAFAVTGVVKSGLDAANIARSTYYYWLENDPSFAERVEEAREEYHDTVRLQVQSFAMEGFTEELSYQGRKTGDTTRKYSDGLIQFWTRSRMPREFRVNQGIELSESPEMADVRERFLDRLAAMAERMQSDESKSSE
jgi:hypothetical protein